MSSGASRLLLCGSPPSMNWDKYMKILVNGATNLSDVPGLDVVLPYAQVAFAPDEAHLAKELPDAEILLGWDFRGRELSSQWQHAHSLKWIHWCGAGVDAVLFDELIQSDVILTNARGLFDRAMAEYVLGYMLMETKRFLESWAFQKERQWQYRLTPMLSGQRAVIVGVGSMGREIATLLNAVGVHVTGVGRRARTADPVFERIDAQSDLLRGVSVVEWVSGALPATPATEKMFNQAVFAAMAPTARFVNVGRGNAVDEPALLRALEAGEIAGAMLDVFRDEPLSTSAPLWQAPHLMISPHMSGDYTGFHRDMVQQFVANLTNYRHGAALFNVVDKRLGFVPTKL
jgi:phosphoglycerate dehydrogenase-like enzyme